MRVQLRERNFEGLQRRAAPSVRLHGQQITEPQAPCGSSVSSKETHARIYF